MANDLRSRDAFTVRRCQILLLCAAGRPPSQIAQNLGCTAPTVHQAIHAFARERLDCLQPKSSRPHTVRAFLDHRFAESLKDLLHHRPRLFGKPISLWTLNLLAEVCRTKGWTSRRLTAAAIRLAVKRLGNRWKRAKHWLSSSDPAYARQKSPRPPDPVGPKLSGLGAGLSG